MRHRRSKKAPILKIEVLQGSELCLEPCALVCRVVVKNAGWPELPGHATLSLSNGVEDLQNDTFKRAQGNRVPLGRMAKRIEVVGAALFLASNASSYVQCIFVNAGLSAG